MKTKRRTLIVLLVFVLAAGAALALLTREPEGRTGRQ